VRSIRFVGLPFVFAGRGWRIDTILTMTNDKVQMPNKTQSPNFKKKLGLEKQTAHEFKISMNSLFEQGENVAAGSLLSSWKLETGRD
jgi:hypothetical protein